MTWWGDLPRQSVLDLDGDIEIKASAQVAGKSFKATNLECLYDGDKSSYEGSILDIPSALVLKSPANGFGYEREETRFNGGHDVDEHWSASTSPTTLASHSVAMACCCFYPDRGDFSVCSVHSQIR